LAQGSSIVSIVHRSAMWASSCVLLVAAQRDLFQAPVNPGFLASPVSSPAYPQTLGAAPAAFEGGVVLPVSAAPPAPSSDYLVATCAVAMLAVAGYTVAYRAAGSRAPAPSREVSMSVAPALVAQPRVAASPFPGADAAVLSECLGQVQDLIAEMTSSPQALKETLENSAHVKALAAREPAVASALKDSTTLAKEMQLLDVMHQILGGMRGALSDPAKRQQAREELQRLQAEAEVPAARARFARAASSRAGTPAMQLSQIRKTSKKITGFDREGVFEARELSEPKEPVKLLNRISELRVLTSLADLGLLSKAEKAGVFSKLENAGAFSLAEKLLPLADDLNLLGTLENLLNVPANIQVFAAVAVLGGELLLINVVPDDNAALIAIQVITGLLAGGGAVTILASAYLFSLLQGEN